MLKRILTVATGIGLGAVLALGFTQLAVTFGWLPGRDLDAQARRYREVMAIVHEHYYDGDAASYKNLGDDALQGMISALDPHSEFMLPHDYQSLEEDMDGKFGGIGVQVEMVKGKLTVIAPIAGSPGDRAGIRRGDQIVGVDDADVSKDSMEAIVSRLRGKPGSMVRLGIFRPETGETLSFDLSREVIRVESVREVRMLEPRIGYVQLTQFSGSTGAELNQALARLDKEGARSLVLDLRNNPGGLLDQAVAVAGFFFPKGGLVVYTQGRTDDSREEFHTSRDGPWLNRPVAILVNSGSASASEVVSGALKDTHRAVLVGERTFGKGSVQSIFQLDHGEGLRLTTARYYTPSGITIHGHGIEPDIALELTADDEAKLRIQRARSDITDPLQFKERFGFAPIVDSQLSAATDTLRAILLLDQRAKGTGGASK